jgi:hypothetical protein
LKGGPLHAQIPEDMPAAHGWAIDRICPGGQAPMQNRRQFLLTATSGLVAMGFVASVSVFADELLGVITKIDVDAKKLTVEEKDTDKEVEITVNDDTEVVSKKGSSKVDLEKLEKGLKKAQDAGKKGLTVKITHEKKIASKLEFMKKKGAGKKKDN